MIGCPLVVAAMLVCFAVPVSAQPVGPWLGDLDFPTNMAFAPDGRLFFTEKETGLVRVVDAGGTLRPEPFATFAVRGGGETGLLGIALHPSFGQGEPWMYLYVSDPATGMNRLVRVRAEGDTAGEPEMLLETVPATNAYHNGGDLLFGADGMLYVSVGEAHEPARAQDPSNLGGKVLRLTPEGEPAPGNPFGEGNAAFTLGHRNSFGLCLDPATGTIWETENGPDRDDEVNRLEAGANYGWPVLTGAGGDGRYADPVSVFPRTVALTGCAWLAGTLYIGSFTDGGIRSLDPVTGSTDDVARFDAGVTDLQAGPDGRLYVATAEQIWRFTPGDDPAPGMVNGSLRPPDRDRGWIAVVAAAVLVLGLLWRVRAGRRLRS
ncbi:MAG: PQQ-dependent sugar dehydrogenase [Actinomycetota bacterium]